MCINESTLRQLQKKDFYKTSSKVHSSVSPFTVLSYVQDISSVFIFQVNQKHKLKQSNLTSSHLSPGQHYLFLMFQVYLTIPLHLFPSELLQYWNIYKLSLKESEFFKAMFQIQVQ